MGNHSLSRDTNIRTESVHRLIRNEYIPRTSPAPHPPRSSMHLARVFAQLSVNKINFGGLVVYFVVLKHVLVLYFYFLFNLFYVNILVMNMKQKKRKIEPRIKLNYNISLAVSENSSE